MAHTPRRSSPETGIRHVDRRVVAASIDVGQVVPANQSLGVVYATDRFEVPVPLPVVGGVASGTGGEVDAECAAVVVVIVILVVCVRW